MKKQNGFSLIEILVVLVIMGLLISVVAPTVLNSADDARVQKVQADFKAIETALKIYRLDNYVYPSTEQGLVALVEPSTLEPEPRNVVGFPRKILACLRYVSNLLSYVGSSEFWLIAPFPYSDTPSKRFPTVSKAMHIPLMF